MNSHRVLFLFVVLLDSLTNAFSATPGERDTNFVTLDGTEMPPSQLAFARNGGIYAAGGFKRYGGANTDGIVLLTPSGQLDPAFVPPSLRYVLDPVVIGNVVVFPGVDRPGKVTGVEVLADQRVAVVGEFTRANGVAVSNLVVLNGDGAVVSRLETNLTGLEISGALASRTDGVFAYGKWALDPGTNGVAGGRLPIALITSGGARAGSFLPPTLAELGLQLAAVTHALPGPTNTLYVFITSLSLDGHSAYEILRLTYTGVLDPSFADGGRAIISEIRPPFARTARQGELYLSGPGHFRGVALPAPLTRITLAGEIDVAFHPAIPSIGQPYLAAQADGRLVMYNSGTAEFLIRVQTDGARDLGYRNPAAVPSRVDITPASVQVGPDDAAYVLGSFLTITPAFELIIRHGVIRIHAEPLPTLPALIQTLTAGGWQLSWPAGYRLQSSPSLATPAWSDVSGALSPFPVPMSSPAEFFRLVAP